MCEGGKLCELHRDFLNGEKVHIWGGGRGVALEMENDQTGLLHTAVADLTEVRHRREFSSLNVRPFTGGLCCLE